MHERLLAELLPKYGILYISSLSTAIPPEVGRTYKQGDCPRCASHLDSYSLYSRGLVLHSACFRNAAWHAHGTKVFEGSARCPELLGFGGCAESLTTDICPLSVPTTWQKNKIISYCAGDPAYVLCMSTRPQWEDGHRVNLGHQGFASLCFPTLIALLLLFVRNNNRPTVSGRRAILRQAVLDI